MSPATIPWFVAPIVTAASPGQHAGARVEPGPERPDRRDEVQRRADRALGVVLAGDRRAPDGHHRVADELLDRAAVPADHLAGELEVARQELARLLGVAPLGEGREADEVGEQDRDEAALGDRAGGGRAVGRPARWPSAVAPRRPSASRTPRRTSRPGASAEPQLVQLAWSDVPHSGQKRALAGAAAPHFVHVMPSMALDDRRA